MEAFKRLYLKNELIIHYIVIEERINKKIMWRRNNQTNFFVFIIDKCAYDPTIEMCQLHMWRHVHTLYAHKIGGGGMLFLAAW
jgi:hypothetical protein